MVHAYILVQTEVGKSSLVTHAVRRLDGVTSAENVTRPYSVIARIEAPTVDDLGRAVIAKIKELPHITRTTTCTVVHF